MFQIEKDGVVVKADTASEFCTALGLFVGIPIEREVHERIHRFETNWD